MKRLLDKVVVRPDSGCWEFNGARDPAGYGAIKVDGKKRNTHRVLYEILVGPIPDGLDLDHLCRNRCCCNPKHLEPVTRRENCIRGDCGEHLRRKTHCPHGHPYSGDNLLIRKRARGVERRCKTCDKETKRKSRARLRGLLD